MEDLFESDSDETILPPDSPVAKRPREQSCARPDDDPSQRPGPRWGAPVQARATTAWKDAGPAVVTPAQLAVSSRRVITKIPVHTSDPAETNAKRRATMEQQRDLVANSGLTMEQARARVKELRAQHKADAMTPEEKTFSDRQRERGRRTHDLGAPHKALEDRKTKPRAKKKELSPNRIERLRVARYVNAPRIMPKVLKRAKELVISVAPPGVLPHEIRVFGDRYLAELEWKDVPTQLMVNLVNDINAYINSDPKAFPGDEKCASMTAAAARKYAVMLLGREDPGMHVGSEGFQPLAMEDFDEIGE